MPASTTNQPIDLKALRLDEEETVSDWFKSHVVLSYETLGQDSERVEKLVWSKPKSYINRVHYLIYKNFLFVGGDLGEAVYEWSEYVSLKWLAMLDIGYFGGKCRASSEEPRGKDWYPERVQARIEEWLKNWADENMLPCPKCSTYVPGLESSVEEDDDSCSTCKGQEVVPRAPLTFQECVELMLEEDGVNLEEAIRNPHSWGLFASECEGLILSNEKKRRSFLYAYKPGEDKEYYPRFEFDGDQYDVGYSWDLRTRAHLEGLKLAWKQLQEKQDVSPDHDPV